MYYLCICQARVHANETRMLMRTKMHECSSCKSKCTSAVHANQRFTSAVSANHDVHGSRLTSCVYTHALNGHFYVINLLCTRRLFCKYFQTCRVMWLPHVCIVKFKLSCTVCDLAYTKNPCGYRDNSWFMNG